MANHFIMWRSNRSGDNEAPQKMRDVKNVLGSHGWSLDHGQGDRYIESGTVHQLQAFINNIPKNAGDSYFIYLDDISQLINNEPCVTSLDDNNNVEHYELSNIDTAFLGHNMERLLIVARGKYSGLSANNISQLINAGEPVNYAYSMAPYEDFEPDNYDLYTYLVTYQNITWTELWEAMKDAVNEVKGAPYPQNANYGP